MSAFFPYPTPASPHRLAQSGLGHADVLSERSGGTRALLPSSHNGWEHVSLCPAVLRAHWVLGTLRAALEGAQPRARVPRPAVWGGPHRVWLGA